MDKAGLGARGRLQAMGFNARGPWRKGGALAGRNAAATFWVWGCGMIGGSGRE